MTHHCSPLITAIVICVLLCPQTMALDNAGKTIIANGKVQAFNPEQNRELARRSEIFKQDRVTTGAKSHSQFRMLDGGMLSLQESSELLVMDYQFNQQTQQGNVHLNLLKGGLRSISGALKANQDNYQLQTPVASIGIRGTHYEAELVTGDLYLAVWQGIIDVTVSLGATPPFSLGDGQDFRFAVIRDDGSVEFIINSPQAFSDGHSSDVAVPDLRLASLSLEQKKNLHRPLTNNLADNGANTEISAADQSESLYIDNDQLWAGLFPTENQIIASRSGEVIFDQIAEHQISSSNGAIDNLAMSMTVNFDTGRVPTGQLSFTDVQGEWFAVFNGIINLNALDVNINFASHNNNLAEGTLTGFFINNGSGVFGDVKLFEINDLANQAGGSFVLNER